VSSATKKIKILLNSCSFLSGKKTFFSHLVSSGQTDKAVKFINQQQPEITIRQKIVHLDHPEVPTLDDVGRLLKKMWTV